MPEVLQLKTTFWPLTCMCSYHEKFTCESSHHEAPKLAEVSLCSAKYEAWQTPVFDELFDHDQDYNHFVKKQLYTLSAYRFIGYHLLFARAAILFLFLREFLFSLTFDVHEEGRFFLFTPFITS